MMDRGVAADPDFKTRLLAQVPQDQYYFPGLTQGEVAEVLVNY